MKKSFRIRKPLALILSLALLLGCVDGISMVSAAGDKFSYTDFEGKSSPFQYNGKSGMSNGQFYTYNGNTALLINNVDKSFDGLLPDGSLEGEGMTNDGAWQKFSYNIGNEGFRPTQVSFYFKTASKCGSNGKYANTHFQIYPLTYGGNNSKPPITQAYALDFMYSGAKRQIGWSGSTSAALITPKSAAADAVTVFKEITPVVFNNKDPKNPNNTVDTSVITISETDMDLTGTADGRTANAELLETIKWYKIEINYTWDDTNGKVTVDAAIIDGENEYHNKSTVTYDPAYIEDVYNFGICTDNLGNPFLIDNLAYTCENPKTGEVSAPDYTAAFFEKYAELLKKSVDDITLADETAVKSALADYELYDAANQAKLSKEKALLDQFMEKIEELKAGSALDEYQEFLQKHAAALSILESTVRIQDEEKITAALTDYKLLSNDTKELLKEQKEHLDRLLKVIGVLKVQQELNYTQPTVEEGFLGYPKKTPVAVEDFEDPDSIRIWTKTGIIATNNGKPLINNGEAFDMAIVEDPSNPGNHVLGLTGIYGAAVPYGFALPNHASMTYVKYDLTQLEQCGYDGGYVLFPAYKDADNYVRVELALGSDGVAKYRWGGMINGVSYSKGSGSQGTLTEGADYSKGVTVEFDYKPESLQINVTLTSIALNANNEHVSTSFSFNYGKADWTFALGSRYNVYAQNTINAKSVYYDNLTATFQEGDWDDDAEIYKPIIYFAENTLVTGGDTALIYGENLGDTVASVQMVQLPDTRSEKPGYILQDRYDRKASGLNWIDPSNPKAAFDAVEGDPVTLKIVQTTENCLKVEIPTQFTTGVYALCFVPKVSAAEPTYIYMNAPVLDFVVGSDGETVEAGKDIRVIGKGLSLAAENGDGYTDPAEIQELGVRAWIMGAGGYSKECTVSAVQSQYSISVRIPNDTPNGNYELYVYNGYGDGSTWSAPIDIKVAGSPWDKRPDRVFNVLDYGGDPAVEGNDTPAIIAALEAASRNGGGTVYLPAGYYVIYYAIPLPQNVHLMGDGKDETRIIFNYTPFDFGELPTGMFITEGNVEISELAIYSVREFPVLTSSTPNIENVYFHDATIRVHRYQGVLGQGGGGKPLKDPNGKSLETLFSEENEGEGKKLAFIFKQKVSNLKITDNIIEGSGSFIFARTSYSVIANNDTNITEMRMNKVYDGESNIFENNTAEGYLGGALEGNGIYVANNEMGNVNSNNREIITTDGKPNYSADERKGIIEKIEDTPENRELYPYLAIAPDSCYRFADGSSYKTENYWKESNLMVTQGQGELQVRTIIYSKDDLIVVDTPFVVEPNRNSRVQIEDARQWLYNINNTYVNGGKVGTFGVQVGAVYDGNTFDSCLGYNHVSQGDGVVWYVSMVNTIYHNGSFWHTSGSTDVTGETTNHAGVGFESRSAGKNGISAIVMRNIELNKGAKIIFINPYRLGFGDFLIDNCSVNDGENAVVFGDNNGAAISFEGLTIAGLSCTDVKTPYLGNYKPLLDQTNDYKSNVITMTYGPAAEDGLLGDVNNDGQVTIMDALIIRQYLIGEVELTDAMKKNADVNNDKVISILDALRIRLSLVGQATLKK